MVIKLLMFKFDNLLINKSQSWLFVYGFVMKRQLLQIKKKLITYVSNNVKK